MFLSLLVFSALGIAYNKLIRHTRILQIQWRVTSARTMSEKERIHMAQSNKRSKALVKQSSITKRIMRRTLMEAGTQMVATINTTIVCTPVRPE